MSKYIRLAVHEIPFDGDKVIVSLRPLKLKDVLRVRSLIAEDGSVSSDRVAELFAEIVPVYVEQLRELKDAAGNLVTIDEVAEQAYFAPLLSEIGQLLVQGASIQRPQSPGASSEG